MVTTDRSNPSGAQSTQTTPLAGLQVIELSSFVAAPLGGMTLAQLGAEVIRIDPIGGGPDQHRWPITNDGASLYWAGLNKGKRSVTVDLRAEPGRDLVRQLVGSCAPGTAVVVTNSAGQDWLSYDELRRYQADLIHVQVHGHSDGTPAVDYTVNAEMGFPLVTGPANHADPVNHVLPAWDIACGLYVATGVAAATRHRELTGEGCKLTIALSDVALAMAGNLGMLAEAEVTKVQRPRIGNYLYGSFARDFSSVDGRRFMVVALTRRHWRDLLTVTETQVAVSALEDALGVDFSREDDRYEYREALAGLFDRWFSRCTSAEVEAALSATALLWAPYRTFTDVVAHLGTSAGKNPIVEQIDQPGIGSYLSPGSPLVQDGRPVRARPAPLLGTDTYPVLTERLGLQREELSRLRSAGVLPEQ
ncbi:CoA transferase [Antrihabitans stalactiti]|uniref:2-methylfumaryl-CoA isomerase n=1 Tax=Antrihabitans stalactiti TaxID=2584121 RepID=A0A848KCW1_9NOCA|nr:CoA transferase [Antrihabitans stalactiti]NMN93887.1 2-methylfumaryl-CoA isomerase [Antrihabitans stalactiti]